MIKFGSMSSDIAILGQKNARKKITNDHVLTLLDIFGRASPFNNFQYHGVKIYKTEKCEHFFECGNKHEN
jgi:hypothetical protein